MDLHEKEKMYQRLIIFTLLIGMVIYYFEKIFCFLGWIGQMCLPFLLGAGLAFVFNIISNNLMRYSIKWFDIKDTKIKRIISNVLSVLIVFAVFVAFVGIVIPRILFSIQLLLTNFPKMTYELYIWLLDVTKNIDVIHDSLKNLDINAFSTFAIDNVSKKISSWLVSGGANDIFGSIFTILSTTFSWFAQAFISIVFSFLLLFNKEQVVHETKSLLKAYLHQVSFFAVFRPLFYLLYIVSVAIIVLYGSNLIINDPAGKYVAADLLTFYLYAGQFSNPMTSFAEQFNSFQESLTAMERICIILDVKPEVLDKEDAKDVDKLIGKVEFKHVWFSYIPGEWILKDVSFVINPGETAAFVGATGAGKSTIISLITRNYEAQKGEILIDDKPIGEYTLNSLRKHIGSMLQDVFLFAGTISENISLFDNAIDKKDVISSCEYVGANNFIEKLPNKYDEMIQERGNNFSMGQRQLISFARVVLYHPNIMLMDEATANIDTETEVLIQKSLKKMKNIGTMIIVAHRLSTIKHADKIFVISQGKIIESGNHQELLNVHGMYYNLYRLQNMEKKKDEEI